MINDIISFCTSHDKILLDITTTLLGLLYIYYNYHQRITMWFVGFIMQVLGIVLYYRSGLYADCGMEFYYCGMTIYGYYMWRFGGNKNNKNTSLPITHIPLRRFLISFSFFVILWTIIWYALAYHTDSRVPIADSFTTALSLIGIWMLARKYIEQWIVWLLVDIVTSALYFYKGIPFKASLYLLYVVIAVFGYAKWKKEMVKQ